MAETKGPVGVPTAKALEDAMAGMESTYGPLEGGYDAVVVNYLRQMVWQQLWLEYNLSRQADKLFMLRESVRTLVAALEGGTHNIMLEHGLVAKMLEILNKELAEEEE